MRRVATKLAQQSITKVDYDAHGSFGATTILRRFGQWNRALQSAGLDAPNRQHIPDAELFENVANVWTRIGRQPFGREIEKTNGASIFSLGTYEKRFGTWNNALIAFEQFINSGKVTAAPAKESRLPQTGKRTPKKINWRLRAQLLIRDNCICQMCGASPAKDPAVTLHADHIVPWTKGGETTLENLRTLCATCNIGKSDMHDSP